MATFSVNTTRFSPYASYRFLVYFVPDTAPVAAINKVGAMTWSADVIDYREGGNPIVLKSLGRVKYTPITLERGLTHDTAFEDWANAAQVLDSGQPNTSLKNLRKELRIDLLNEAGQPVIRYKVHRGWVSEYQAMPDLDANTNAIAIQHVKIEHEGWERDPSLTEPAEK